MSKSFIKSGFVVLAVLALASCAKTEDLYRNPDSVLQIEFVSGISPFTLMQNPVSKAVITGESLPGDEAAKGIGLFVTAQDGGAYDGHDKGYTNVKYTFDGSKWSAQSPIYLSNTTGKLYGYFPYSADATDLKAIPVASSLNGTDYLYATPQEVSFGKPATIQMKHALARLHLTIVKGENYKGSGILSGITLNGTAIGATGVLDLTDGTVTAQKGAGNVGVVQLAADGTIDRTGITKDILLVTDNKTAVSSDLAISLAIDGTVAGVSLSADNGVVICQGVQYDLTLTVEDTGIKVSSVDVGNWDKQDSHQVQVGACTVTVKLAEEQLPELADDIVFIVTPHKNEDGKVIVEALSKSQKRLGCYLSGEASYNAGTGAPIGSYVPNKFTISNITTNITATIGYPRPESINFQVSSLTAYVGCSFKLKETVLPNDTYNKKFTWSSSNPSVATVDENGLVIPVAEGTADITATTEVGGLIATCKTKIEAIALSGVFSVGPADNCKTVRFSQGNLRYTPSIESWWFFDNQYEYGHSQDELSLFTWGYGSWSTDWKTTSYQTGNFTDWGKQIGDGNIWRILTKDEWTYLLESREGNRFAKARIHGTYGLLIFPDGYSLPSGYSSGGGIGISTVNAKEVAFPSGNIPDEIWSEMEAVGAVFLPAAGMRNAELSPTVGEHCCYWVLLSGESYILLINIDELGLVSIPGYGGLSVRLVTNSN